MVNVTTTPEGNLLAYVDGEPVMYNLGDVAWVTAGTAIVSVFVPGLALLYSGLMRHKNALSMLFLAFATFSVGTLHWMMIGEPQSLSPTGGSFIGDLKHGGLVGVDINPSPVANIPDLLYMVFQSQFSAITAVVVVGGAAERARMLPVLVFMFCWSTVVYCPVAHWVWDAKGWLYQLGELDYAGGGPVHIASGVGAFTLSYFLGPRRGYGTTKLDYRPHSATLICLGTGFIWFGWLAFNGASMSAMNLKSVQCVVNTNIAASSGALAWTALDYRYTGKYSVTGLCSGILAGMIGITPAVGYVGAPAAIAVGACTAVAANCATSVKVFLKVDDPVDAFAMHGLGGVAGAILTGFFADSRVTSFDGITEIPGGWINHHWIQLGYQLAGCVTIFAYTAVVSYALLFIINLIPGLKLRASEEDEIVGIDLAETGESAYDALCRDGDDRTSFRGRSPEPATGSQSSNGAAKESMGAVEEVRTGGN
ncbi:hypothetical protein JCM21900_004810 [Sporobolomyces salmonicolor]